MVKLGANSNFIMSLRLSQQIPQDHEKSRGVPEKGVFILDSVLSHCPMTVPQTIKKDSHFCKPLILLAGGQGFEPWLTESESVVLPLDDPPSNP